MDGAWAFFLAVFGACFLYLPPAGAAPSVADATSAINQAVQLLGEVSDAIVKTIGLAADHRPYEPATPLGTVIGLDIGVEASLVKIPDDFGAAVSKAGISTAAAVPVLPVPRLNIHKGLGAVDLGASYISYQGLSFIGGDIKILLSQPEEGPTWALRFCYGTSNLGFVKTKTYTPQILMSKRMDFADPYIGVGFQYITGTFILPTPAALAALPPGSGLRLDFSKDSSAISGLAFTGVSFRVVPLGVRLTLEGAYNVAGAHSLGLKVSLSF